MSRNDDSMSRTNQKKIVFVDAFAGCGGLSLGLLQAGLEGKFAIEHDEFAFATLRANLLSKDSPFQFKWPRWLPREPIGIGKLLREYKERIEESAATLIIFRTLIIYLQDIFSVFEESSAYSHRSTLFVSLTSSIFLSAYLQRITTNRLASYTYPSDQ